MKYCENYQNATEAQRKQMLLEKRLDRVALQRVATNLQFLNV